jgi:hypothetical protein
MTESVAAWMTVLERIEQSLEQSLRRTPEVQPIPRDPAAGEDATLLRLDQRFEHWQACLDRVEGEATAAEGALDAEQAAVRVWLTNCSDVRQRLAARPLIPS